MSESQNTEYKQTWRDEYLKWISGFANAEGGVLVIGRDDVGKVLGLKDAKKLLEDIPNILFHPDPEYFVTAAFVKIGYFNSDSDLAYQDEIHGDLFNQVDRTLDLLLTKYMKALISYEGAQRVETYSVPEDALREAVTNAIVHKDYSRGAPIQISVYADKLMIWNPGQLPADWTVESLLKKHSSQPYNPDIANVFFRAGMIESWGRGIERILEACDKAGAPKPKLRYETTGLWLEFPIKPTSDALSGEETAQETAQETTQETTQERILRRIQNQPTITRKELAQKLELSDSGVKYHLDKLRKAEVIKHVGPTKAGHWEVLK